MRKICAKLVPKNLTIEHKENRRNVCLDLLEHIENDESFFKHVITGCNECKFWDFRIKTCLTPCNNFANRLASQHSLSV
jgi:hypothetical protein